MAPPGLFLSSILEKQFYTTFFKNFFTNVFFLIDRVIYLPLDAEGHSASYPSSYLQSEALHGKALRPKEVVDKNSMK